MQSNITFVYFSVDSTTCFGLTDHLQVDQEFKSMYTVIWKITFKFLGAFAKLQKVTINFIMSICLSVWSPIHLHGKRGSHWTEFHEIWYFSIFQKSVQKIQVTLKSDETNGYFIWRPIYTFDHTLLSSSLNEKCFSQICRENQNTHFLISNCIIFIFKSCLYDVMWKNIVELDRPHMTIWWVHVHCMLVS